MQLLGNILTAITGDSDCYVIDRTLDDRGVLLRVHIDQPHAGRVIGRGGETAVALRQVLKALAAQHDARYNLLISVRESR